MHAQVASIRAMLQTAPVTRSPETLKSNYMPIIVCIRHWRPTICAV